MILHLILLSPLTPIEDILRHVLNWFHGSVGLPWAWSIVALTLTVRLLLVPLTVRQIHSMQNLQRHAPQMKEIQKKYKDDKKRQQEELMKFYRENQINPAASCLPLLAQFPVFISLYFVLREFSKHPSRAATSRGSATTSSRTSPRTPMRTGRATCCSRSTWRASSSRRLMSSTMDKTQRIMLMVLPVVFVPFLLNFPVGLVIYWVTTNLWTVGQGLITRRLVPKPPGDPSDARSRTPPKDEPEHRRRRLRPPSRRPRRPQRRAEPPRG